MKRAILSLIAFSCCVLHAAPSGRLRLTWDPTPGDSPDDVFNLYGSPTLATPMSSWPLITNSVGMSHLIEVTITPGQYFFALTVSNLWGESGKSEVLSLPNLPATGPKLKAVRGD